MSDTLSATVDLLDGMAFRATSGTGHVVVMDAAPEVGGGDSGGRPMEMLLLGLGGCTGMDVISMLRKMRQDVSSYQIRLRGERATEHPKIFTAITVEHVVRGRALGLEAVKRAVELSATRYCSAAAMLGRAAHIDETYRIIDDTTGQEQTGALALAA
jgi:putative redox protein